MAFERSLAPDAAHTLLLTVGTARSSPMELFAQLEGCIPNEIELKRWYAPLTATRQLPSYERGELPNDRRGIDQRTKPRSQIGRKKTA